MVIDAMYGDGAFWVTVSDEAQIISSYTTIGSPVNERTGVTTLIALVATEFLVRDRDVDLAISVVLVATNVDKLDTFLQTKGRSLELYGTGC